MRTSSKLPLRTKTQIKARTHHYVKYKNKINEIKRKLYNQSKKKPNEKCCFSFQAMFHLCLCLPSSSPNDNNRGWFFALIFMCVFGFGIIIILHFNVFFLFFFMLPHSWMNVKGNSVEKCRCCCWCFPQKIHLHSKTITAQINTHNGSNN